MMRSSLDHIPHRKQQELARALEILHEEFEDALGEGTADFKKRGRILKIVLFGSYARGTFVDEPHTMKGYRSDFDLLVIVNNRKLTDHATFWYKAADRIIRDSFIETPTQFIVHSLREVNTELKKGHYFFSDIRKEGIVVYELDGEPLAEPKLLTAEERLEVARGHFKQRYAEAVAFHVTAGIQANMVNSGDNVWRNLAAFSLHQALEQSYSCVLLTLTNYGPASHNIKFLRSLAEEQDLRLVDAFPRDQHRQRAWFNTVNEAYVKARYSKHFEISEEALVWLGERTAHLLELVKAVCDEHIEKLERDVRMGRGESGH
ncbi:nucleotidyltransferase and HEPN domain-containing protein [Rhizobium pusense]|uniref:HEPN domain-containing protein n=3 Tax=Pseudomonadota TaxID=1224 RepID=A0A9W5B3Z7_9HYPH|nr:MULTISPECIES: nucleotidyltransferase and HEPN domain-containing protein [Rhizobium/Agrobacterium group]MDH0912683.1 nucleotidyltransferase and HEPN domain-containing protein [Agrobacterium pusense]MDH1098967.1 nucleotidyltransferase and HEPN domain-containing protein [Agrobacterium pusense]MDH1115431.1 nucleotidyltransferase and HEPN domain-containing protein [Agrobacterium pusense]MDH2197409.1 nucleotidyltransferase and HEPN domain-containing protein [Agrobacterium pusense]OJH51678.1 nucle